MSEDKETIYSWSRINSYYQALKGEGCLYGYYKQYIEKDRENAEDNYFSEYGTLLHNLSEKIHNGELLIWDIGEEIDNGLNEFKYRPPFPNMEKSYEAAIHKFFEDFYEIFDGFKVRSTEEEVVFLVGNKKFKGFIDLDAEHEFHGNVIVDYKTSKVYEGENLEHKIRQLYLYSIAYYNKYGKYPDVLIYIFTREKYDRVKIYEFNLEKLEDTKKWALDMVHKIETHDGEWTPRCCSVDGSKDFYASQLCSYRNNCPFRYCNSKKE